MDIKKQTITICKDISIISRYHALNVHQRQELKKLTSFLDDIYGNKTQWSQRIWHVEHDCYEPMYCKWCGKPMIYSKDRKKYCVHKECLGKEISVSMNNMTKEQIDLATKKRKETNRQKYGTDFASQTEKTKEEIKKRNMEKYGVSNTMKLQENKDKVIKTCLEKYGAENFSKTDEFKEKTKQTCLEKYGVSNPALLKETHEKAKQTCLEKYGAEHYSKTDEFKEKYEQTCLERYGLKNYFQTDKFKEKAKQTCLEKYEQDNYAKTDEFKERFKETNLKLFGVENFSKTDEFKEKFKETNRQKYGVDWRQQTEEYKQYYEKLVIKKFKKFLERFGLQDDYEYIENLHNGNHKLKCNTCNQEFAINTKGFYYNRTRSNQKLCPFCNPLHKAYSQGEKELLEFIRSIYSGDIIENTRKVISPYELDIYLPKLNLAIEYNGLYWHSSEQKSNDYHKMKSDICKEKGIHLIHIFEDDWLLKTDIIKSILLNFISPSNNKIFARKCEIRSVSLKDCNKFLTENHLLGSISAFSFCHGLYYNNELISLMTFKLVSKETNQYELSRYAIKCNYKIIGGAEKLLSYFINNSHVEISSIITYNDNSIFKGNVYHKLGFSYIRTNSPNYMFITKDTDYLLRISKQSIRKLKVGYKKETELELGYLRVYNAGNDVYLLDKENIFRKTKIL